MSGTPQRPRPRFLPWSSSQNSVDPVATPSVRARLAFWMPLAAIVCLSLSGAAEEASSPPDARDFGAPLTLTTVTPLGEVIEAPARHAEAEILLRARLSDVCQKKGCWTIARDGDASVRVRFKDYGFFLPTDSIGAEALIQGRVEVLTLSEREAKHYEAESREGDPDSIDGPVREVSLIASGVRLLAPEGEPHPTEP